mmetsp:Transcript_20283/g.61597  ORF Transcript_20283/g.61597 Transcript_20283/m.61597 type:complete len:92 (-) Transcript_20283:70-345(-)
MRCGSTPDVFESVAAPAPAPPVGGRQGDRHLEGAIVEIMQRHDSHLPRGRWLCVRTAFEPGQRRTVVYCRELLAGGGVGAEVALTLTLPFP